MARFLIVGGAGYIGAHMVKAINDAGHQAVVLDNLSTGHARAVSGADLIRGDTGDRDVLDRIFSTRAIDCVMHFAAFLQVGESVDHPLKYYRNNSGNTLVLLQAMKDHGVRRFILSSSAAVYGEPKKIPLTEDMPARPVNPYGRSKLFVEQVLADCHRAHGLDYISLRYFNAAGADPGGLIGEDHTPETHLVPLALRTALGKQEQVRVYGTNHPTPDGTCLRDYVHVSDLAQAHLLAARSLLDGGQSGIYNLGAQKGVSVLEIIDMARKITGRPIPVKHTLPRPGDPAVLVACAQKAMDELGWKPRYTDPEAIIATAWKWHKSHPNGYE